MEHSQQRDADAFPNTRQTLLSRLRDWEDRESWQEFFDTYWKLIYGSSRKAGLTDAEAQEVVQEVVVAAAKQLPKFRYDPTIGSFKGWLLRITQRRVADCYKKRPPWAFQKAKNPNGLDERRTATLERLPDPCGERIEEFWEHEWQRNLIDAAMLRVKGLVKTKQFQIFDLYVNKEWAVSDICEWLQVSATQVYLAKHRVSKLVRKEIERLQKKLE